MQNNAFIKSILYIKWHHLLSINWILKSFCFAITVQIIFKGITHTLSIKYDAVKIIFMHWNLKAVELNEIEWYFLKRFKLIFWNWKALLSYTKVRWHNKPRQAESDEILCYYMQYWTNHIQYMHNKKHYTQTKVKKHYLDISGVVS